MNRQTEKFILQAAGLPAPGSRGGLQPLYRRWIGCDCALLPDFRDPCPWKTSTWQFLPIFKCWACKQEHLPYDFCPSLIPLRKYLRNLSITRDSCLLFNPNKLSLTPQVRNASAVGLLAPPAFVRSRVWLCNAVDWSPPGSSAHGTLQARRLEWVATPSSRSSWPRDGARLFCLLHWQGGSLPLVPAENGETSP